MDNFPKHLKSETILTSKLKVGDTVFINGGLQTIGKNNLKFCDFLGWRFNGVRAKKIERVLFPKWYCGKIIKYQPQI